MNIQLNIHYSLKYIYYFQIKQSLINLVDFHFGPFRLFAYTNMANDVPFYIINFPAARGLIVVKLPNS